ncbi:protein THEM6 isoform X1 [Grammomys surdaster]|uniref:protein THEM6 isoform X1 n=1 Tax=Grammomys surdaster TaxID=491861 RepID=UPI0010A0606D|nr:protein THEM6 isoform X1 [Grammomys surdaster]
MLELLVASLALGLAFFALLDGWYLVRVPCAVLRARLLQPRVRDLLAEQRYAGRVLPSDLDLLLHMNNARYLREADVARAAHLTRCGVLGALRDLSAHTVLAASCARYRRSLRLFEPFEVHTRLLGWDDRAFYLEARFVSLRDGFVCALLRFRQHVLGTSPDRVVQHLCKRRASEPICKDCQAAALSGTLLGQHLHACILHGLSPSQPHRLLPGSRDRHFKRGPAGGTP